MPWELIYTSAPRGLVSGQSGFCTVARTSDLREAVAQRLEQISSYHYLEFSGTGATTRNPTISAYRMLDIRGTRFHALSRVLPCGLDFTKRTNHLAHHLVFAAEELAGLPSPAAILRHWEGWQSTWQGEPRLLPRLSADTFAQLPQAALPAKAWLAVTGDAGRAAGLLENEFARGCYLITPPGGEQLMLDLFCETLQLVNPSGKSPLRAWQHTFTTFLQGEDSVADFHWRALRQGTPAYKQGLGRSVTLVSLNSIRIPNNPLARLAREGAGLPTAIPALAASAASAAPVLRKPLTLAKGASRNQLAPPGRADSAGDPTGRPVARSHSPGGWTISVSKSSLIGFGIACALLAGLVGLLQWMKKHKTTSEPTIVSNVARTNAGAPVQPARDATFTKPTDVGLTAPSTVPKTSEAPFSPVQAAKELDDVLPDMPTYVFVVTNVQSGDIVLGGIEPLMALLQQFNHYNIKPADLDMRFNFNSWGNSGMPPAIPESNPGAHKLIGRGTRDFQPDSELIFDYSGILDAQSREQTVTFRSYFQQDPPTSAICIMFRPAGENSSLLTNTIEPFRMLLINERKPPQSLDLSIRFLKPNPQQGMDRFQEPLEKRLAQFRWSSPVSWHLRPYVPVKNASGAIETDDLYDLLQPEITPEEGHELDFARIKGILMNDCEAKRAESNDIDKQITALQKSSSQQSTNLDLPLAKVFGVGDSNLLSFSTFASSRNNAKPSKGLFLGYLTQIARAGKAGSPWLENWPTNSKDSGHKRLQEFLKLCAKNLDEQSAAKLDLQGSEPNYFNSVWEYLSAQEAAEKLEAKRTPIDNNIKRLQSCINVIPDSLEKTVYVSLSAVTGKNTPLEVIRFSNQKKP